MTLTFAYVDGRYTVHVADRRISIRNSMTGHSVPRDDEAVKIGAPRGSMLLSYTGAADLPHASEPMGDTAQWLKDRLESACSEVESALGGIAAELNHSFFGASLSEEQADRHYHGLGERWTARFAAVGWVHHQS